MKVKFITTNEGKFEWAKRRMAQFGIDLVQEKRELSESRHINVEDVAKGKAESAKKNITDAFFVEDSGFYIEALNNFPATQIKFVIKTIGIEGITKLMKDVENKNVNFRSALVFCSLNEERIFICDDLGTLSAIPKGDNLRGFNDIFKIFIPKGFNKTLAEMSNEEFIAYEKGVEKEDHYVKFAKWFIENKNGKE